MIVLPPFTFGDMTTCNMGNLSLICVIELQHEKVGTLKALDFAMCYFNQSEVTHSSNRTNNHIKLGHIPANISVHSILEFVAVAVAVAAVE